MGEDMERELSIPTEKLQNFFSPKKSNIIQIPDIVQFIYIYINTA